MLTGVGTSELRHMELQTCLSAGLVSSAHDPGLMDSETSLWF